MWVIFFLAFFVLFKDPQAVEAREVIQGETISNGGGCGENNSQCLVGLNCCKRWVTIPGIGSHLWTGCKPCCSNQHCSGVQICR